MVLSQGGDHGSPYSVILLLYEPRHKGRIDDYNTGKAFEVIRIESDNSRDSVPLHCRDEPRIVSVSCRVLDITLPAGAMGRNRAFVADEAKTLDDLRKIGIGLDGQSSPVR